MTEPTDPLAASPDDEALRAPPSVEGLVIQGRVTDFGGLPLVGVRVEAAASGGGDLDLLPTMSDGDGRFVLEGLEAKPYDLRFRLGKVGARTLAVPAGTTDLAVRLARPQGILLVAKTASGAEPPSVLHVVLDRKTEQGLLREHIGRHLATRLLLWSIRPGTYRITVWGGAYLPVTADGVVVRDGRPAPEVQVLLGAHGAAVVGRVHGDGSEDALVAWRRLDAPQPWPRQTCSTRTSESGTFRIQGLPAGRYRLSAGTSGGPVTDLEIEVEDEGTHEVELRL